MSPAERDLGTSGLEAYTVTLLDDLALWETRDDSKAQPAVTRAGYDAVDTIDALTRDLYRLRERLVGEIRASDDAAIARTDWLLRQQESDQ